MAAPTTTTARSGTSTQMRQSLWSPFKTSIPIEQSTRLINSHQRTSRLAHNSPCACRHPTSLQLLQPHPYPKRSGFSFYPRHGNQTRKNGWIKPTPSTACSFSLSFSASRFPTCPAQGPTRVPFDSEAAADGTTMTFATPKVCRLIEGSPDWSTWTNHARPRGHFPGSCR